MQKERFYSQLENLGVSETQVSLLVKHLEKAQEFVFPIDPGVVGSMTWLENSLEQLDSTSAGVLMDIIKSNMPDSKTEYLEAGYDSCQGHRKLSKVVGEAILLGGLTYEADLLGLSMNLGDAQKAVGSGLKLDPNFHEYLVKIAQAYGANQDFIFPGVTPTDSEVLSLADYAVAALSGNPRTSVRNLTGVGGLRHDKDWNFVTDFATFVKLKVTEDKRYYLGIGIFYLLMTREFSNIPIIQQVRDSQPQLYSKLEHFVSVLKNVPKEEYSGVSVLCSSYLAPWHEMKQFQHTLVDKPLDLSTAFHSPSYDLAILNRIFQGVSKDEEVGSFLVEQLDSIGERLSHLWSFNSTIHLPWTAKLASLSSQQMGLITNKFGDNTLRFGVGYRGKSLELREYHFGLDRHFPAEVAGGGQAYVALFYPTSACFVGPAQGFFLNSGDPLWQQIQSKGFMKAGIEFLTAYD